MLFSILQEGISEVAEIFLQKGLKKWWDYHKIDRDIARKIMDTCEDEGFNFDEFLERLGVDKKLIKERLKLLKKSFKEKKTYTATEDFIDKVVESYLDIFLTADNSAILNNPLSSNELELIGKIKQNIQIYLTNFKPIETISSLNLKLKSIKAQNKDNYNYIMQELKKLSSQNESLPENLNILKTIAENMLKEMQIYSRGKKVYDTVSINKLIDIKIAFKDADYKEKKFEVGERYTIKIQANSEIAFTVNKIGVSIEPLDALVAGKNIMYNSHEKGDYIFKLSEGINCSIGQNLVAMINMKGPDPNFKYELIVKLEGQVKEDQMVYQVEKSRGPFVIERVSGIDIIGNILTGLVDKFIDPNFSKTIEKLKEEGEDKYL
ncbi:MAG: hypothetical protein ACFFDF_18495 [Candidatus Odinarchaeota archaeon]